MLFKRKDGDVEADKWLIAEYYKSLSHLSADGLDKLTELLKQTHTFFPTVRECLDATRCGKYDWGHPFVSQHLEGPNRLMRALPPAAPVRQIGYDEGLGG